MSGLGKDPARTFIAVFPPAAVVADLAATVARVRRPGDGVSWTKAGNLHYTLRFLGDLSSGRVEAATRAAAAAVVGVAPFTLTLGGTGAFPDLRRPRVLWIGAAEGGETLALLARSLSVALEREGFPREDKPFVSHLTLGRVRDGGEGDPAVRLAAAEFPPAAFEVRELVVVKSTLSPGGSIYEPVARATLSSG